MDTALLEERSTEHIEELDTAFGQRAACQAHAGHMLVLLGSVALGSNALGEQQYQGLHGVPGGHVRHPIVLLIHMPLADTAT